MKNLIVSLSVAFAVVTAPAYANSVPGEPQAEKVFATQFSGATDVKWSTLNNGYKQVIFTLNGVRAMSFFDASGELLGTMRNLFFNQLPLSVMQTIGNQYSGAVMIETKEITNSEGTSYRVGFEYKEKRYNLRLNSSGDILEQEKIKLKK